MPSQRDKSLTHDCPERLLSLLSLLASAGLTGEAGRFSPRVVSDSIGFP